MKTNRELNEVKEYIDSMYSRFGNSLLVDNTKSYLTDQSALGYCYRTEVPGLTQYTIVTHQTGKPNTDLRVMMHEYGHIYLGHLEGIHEELDSRAIWVLQNSREELIEYINTSCGIDFADKLLNRVMDDPGLNHSLHNIAMDMEVNSRVLDKEDIELMQSEISEILPEVPMVKALQGIIDSPDSSEEDKKKATEALNKYKSEPKIKFIHPESYHLPDGSPWPSGLSYSEYFLMMIKYLDQFVKMLVNLMSGGSGDTSQVSSQELQEALSGGMQSLDDLMNQAGLNPGSGIQPPKDGEDKECPYSSQSGQKKDHGTPERDIADTHREKGEVKGSSGNPGCSKSGSSGGLREVDYNADPIEMALDEVMKNFKSKVIKRDTKRLVMRKYNRGINREIISPSYKMRNVVSLDPTIVFLLDVSGSMNSRLIDRVLTSIAQKMKTIQKGLKYNIITCSTRIEGHYKDIDPRKPIPKIDSGGGTDIAVGFRYFRQHYDTNAVLIVISDFEDSLQDWHKEEESMSGYSMYGFNYGCSRYHQQWTHFIEKDFTSKNGY